MKCVSFWLLPTALLFQLSTAAYSATLAVLPGTSIQAKIDLAVEGDIVAIFGGTYDQDVTVNKRIRLVEVSGQEVTITGNVTFTGVANCPAFEGFTVGSSGKNINVSNTTGLAFKTIDHRNGNSVVVSGASTVLKIDSCQLNNLNADAGLTELSKSSLTGSISQTGGNLHASAITVAGNFNTSGSAAKTIVFRATVTGDCIWVSTRSWFGYGKTRSFNFAGSNAKVIFVGSEIDRLGAENSLGMNLEGNANWYVVTNSSIKGIVGVNDDNNQDNCIELSGNNHKAVIQNNYFDQRSSYNWSRAIQISGSTDVLIRNNIINNNNNDVWAIGAPFGVTIENNCGFPRAPFIVDGATATNSITGDPLFVSNNPYQLGAGSPCIDAGTINALYNDRDSSRNNIGPAGGSWYDPEGWTTTKPVLISFDLSPELVLQGVDTEVTLDEIQAVSAP